MPSNDSMRNVRRAVVVDEFGDASLKEYLRERSRADPEGVEA